MGPCRPFKSPARGGFARTERVDQWWLAPAATAIGLIIFFGYLTFRAFNATYVWFDPYISPTVAPPLFTPVSGYPGAVPVDHAWFGAFPSWWPPFLPQSPAFFIPALAIAFRVDLLLLPRRVLQSGVHEAAQLRRWRRAVAVSR